MVTLQFIGKQLKHWPTPIYVNTCFQPVLPVPILAIFTPGQFFTPSFLFLFSRFSRFPLKRDLDYAHGNCDSVRMAKDEF